MYTVYSDSALIHDQRVGDIDCRIINPTLTEEINSSGSFIFMIPPNNVGYDEIKPMRSTVRIRNGGNTIWIGRPISIVNDFNNCKSVTCEGALGFLHDITYVDTSPMPWSISVPQFVNKVISFYNDRVSSDRRINFSTADIDADNAAVPISYNYMSAYEIINNIASENGLNIFVDCYSGTPRLYMKKNYPYDSSKVIHFGENLLDLSRTTDLTDMVSVIIPRGAPIYPEAENDDDAGGGPSGGSASGSTYSGIAPVGFEAYSVSRNSHSGLNGAETAAVLSIDNPVTVKTDSTVENQTRVNGSSDDNVVYDMSSDPIGYVNISSVNNGNPYLTNEPLYNLYGRIEKVVDFENIEDPGVLLTEAKEWLGNYQFNDLSVEVSLADLSIVDGSQPFKIFTSVRCVSAPHGMDRWFPITKIRTILDDVSQTEITLNSAYSSTLSKVSTSINGEVKNLVTDQKENVGTILQQAKDRARDVIRSCTGGYVTMVQDESKSYVREIVISDTPDWTTSNRFWEWNENGLGYFKRVGGETVDCGLALTMDGEIVADLITAGSMYADRIHGGTLTLGDYDNQAGKIIMLGSDGEQIGSWDQSGLSARGRLQAGSMLPKDNEPCLVLSGGQIRGYVGGEYQGYIDCHASTLYNGNQGYGWHIENDHSIILRTGILGFSKDEWTSDGMKLYHRGESGKVTVVTDSGVAVEWGSMTVVTGVTLNQYSGGGYYISTQTQTINYPITIDGTKVTKNIEFYQGGMVTVLE